MNAREISQTLTTSAPKSPQELTSVHKKGMYAWWDMNGALTPFWPEDFPPVDTSRPLYVGKAPVSLSVRGADMHLKTTRMSTLRRNLTLLLVDELPLRDGLVAKPKKKLSQSNEGERVLTAWMLENLSVTWVELETPGAYESTVIGGLLPPFNDTFAHAGPYWRPMKALRERVWSSAP